MIGLAKDGKRELGKFCDFLVTIAFFTFSASDLDKALSDADFKLRTAISAILFDLLLTICLPALRAIERVF
jgi:hypothetical protein